MREKNVKPKSAFIVHKALMTKLEIVLFYLLHRLAIDAAAGSRLLLYEDKWPGNFCWKICISFA